MSGILVFIITSIIAFAETTKEYEVMPRFTGKPRIFVIGDSTSFGYTPFLEEKLTKYQVVHSPGNAGNSAYGAVNIIKWASASDSWELCLINHGLHDIVEGKKVPFPDYMRNIGHELNVLAKNCKRRMFHTSTMVPKNVVERKNEDVVIYNSLARAVIEKVGGVKSCDLYQKSIEIPQHYKNPEKQDNVHLTIKGDELLADFLIDCMKRDFPEMFK